MAHVTEVESFNLDSMTLQVTLVEEEEVPSQGPLTHLSFGIVSQGTASDICCGSRSRVITYGVLLHYSKDGKKVV